MKTLQTINLFEFSNKEKYSGDLDDLERFLDEIWQKRKLSGFAFDDISGEDATDADSDSKQKFIRLLRKGEIQSRNYVGIIKINDHVINLLPKIFLDKGKDTYAPEEIKAIHVNILWWLSFCPQFKAPMTLSSLASIKSNFFEILIYLFADYTRNTLNTMLYSAYEEINEELPFMRGRLDMNAYIRENLSKARWHKLSCVYDSFEFDNQLNRIIKHVARLLITTTQDDANKRLLSEIVFILDEVSDMKMTYDDCRKVKLNPLYDNLFTVLDYCKLFLSNSVSYSYKDELRVFAFLVPMEELFEKFVYGFIEKHFKGQSEFCNLQCQKSDLYVARLFEDDEISRENVFNLKHDIYFEYKKRKIVIDTKYKLRDTASKKQYSDDKKYGVAQADLYQIISYAIRRKAHDLFLLYPESIASGTTPMPSIKFQVRDEFSNSDIDVRIVDIPIILNDFPNIDLSKSLENIFSVTEEKLKTILTEKLLLS